MGEHFPDTEGVIGSIPIPPTIVSFVEPLRNRGFLHFKEVPSLDAKDESGASSFSPKRKRSRLKHRWCKTKEKRRAALAEPAILLTAVRGTVEGDRRRDS